MHSGPFNVLLADDHELVRAGLRLVLEAVPGWRVCAEAGDGAEAVALAARFLPELAILDIDMPVMNGLDAIREIQRASPRTVELAMTGHADDGVRLRALEGGAVGCVLKGDSASAVLEFVQRITGSAIEPADLVVRAPAARTGSRAGRTLKLTPREIQVVRLLAGGKTNRDASEILGISPKTIESHRASIMQKLQLNSFVELVYYAVQHRLIAA